MNAMIDNKCNLDYPYLSLPDIDEESIGVDEHSGTDNDFMDYPIWERLLEEDIQGIFDRRLEEQ